MSRSNRRGRLLTLVAAVAALYVVTRPPVIEVDAQAPSPSQVGQWSSPVSLPLVGLHLVVMPNGKVFMMSSESQNAGVGAVVWNPAAPGAFVDVASPNA